MWFERFLKLIDESPIGVAIEKRRRLLEYGDDPGRIYVENIRAFLGVTHRIAQALCNLAVRQGLFEPCVALLCPHDERVLAELCDSDQTAPPDELICEVCEASEIEPSSFARRECRALAFYRLREANG